MIALTVVTFRHQMLDLAGAEGETKEMAARYLFWTVPSMSFMAIGLGSMAALRAKGDGKRAMFVTLTSGSVSLFVDPALIIWAGLGLDGAALALVISRIVLTGTALRFAIGTHDLLARPTLLAIRENLKPFLKIALPAMIAQLSTPFGSFLLTGVMAQFGDTAVAAWAVASRLYVMAFGGIFALSGAIGGIFGQNLGAKKFDRLWTTYRDALIFCVSYALIVWVILIMTTPLIVRGFGLTGIGAEVLRAFTITTGVAQGLMGMVFVTNAAFNTLGRPGRSMIVNWSRDGLLMLPVAWWAAGLWGAPGVLYGQAIAGSVVGVLGALWAGRFVKTIAFGQNASA